MWPTKCPRTAGLRCDCVIHYCALISVLIACGILFVMGSCCLFGYGINGDSMISTCLGLGNLGGWVLLIMGATFPFCYIVCFIFLGEAGRSTLGLKDVNDIPS